MDDAPLAAALVQQVFDIPQRQWAAHVHLLPQADDLGACLGIPEDAGIAHAGRAGPRRQPQADGYCAMWAAQAEADVRTTVETARIKGLNPFNTILGVLA